MQAAGRDAADRAGRVVPYLNGGFSLDCDIFETAFHSVPLDAYFKFADLDDFASRVGAALTGPRVGTALRGNDVLRQAILALALRAGIDAM